MLFWAAAPAHEVGGSENGGGSGGRYQKSERPISIIKKDKMVYAKFIF
jgi:hypothetical protein